MVQGLEFEKPSKPRLPSSSPSRKEWRDIGGFRGVGTGYSEPVKIPDGAEAFCCFPELGDIRLEFDRQATDTSTLFVNEDVPLMFYPLAPDQSISFYCAAGDFANFRFLRKY